MRHTLIRATRRLARPLGIVAALVIAGYHLSLSAGSLPPVPFLERLDALMYDLRYRALLDEPPPSEQAIVIVDIDERSLGVEGRWPWSRATVGRLVQRLFDGGAVIVGFDVVFAEPQRNPVDEVLADPRIASSAGPLLRAERERFDADAELASVLGGGEVVLGVFFNSEKDSFIGRLPPPLRRLSADESARLQMRPYTGYAGNVPAVAAAAAGGGSLTAEPDNDGVVRHSPLLYRFGDALYPSLSLEITRRFLLVDDVRIDTVETGGRLAIESIAVGDNVVPTDAEGRVIVPYRGLSPKYTYLSATDVLRDGLDDKARATLAGAIVLVGTSALGLKDLRSTPLQTDFPGVEVHASLIDAILHSTGEGSRFWSRPDYEAGMTAVLIVLLGILIVLVQPRLAATGQVLFSLFALALVVAGNYALWVYAQLDLPLAPPLFCGLLLSAFYLVLGFLEEAERRAQMHSMFGQYVAPAHINRLLEHPERASFDGESKEMTVLFSDVRSFTTISEKLTAQGLKQLLNRYFTPITKIIFDNQGTIDKYVGDMVMAFWGAPLDDPDHAVHAVAAGLAMLEKVDALRAEFGAEGLPQINVGIGINSGSMNVGDMGSSYRRAYTVLGDAVNLGSRLEGATKMYGIRILVGEQTQQRAPQYLFRLIDRLQVKGKLEPVRVYEPLCLRAEATPERLAAVERWHQALEHYDAQRWGDAENALGDLLAHEPECRLYEIFLERVAALRMNPPPPGWDGVYVAKEK